jgi:hypothetical protein
MEEEEVPEILTYDLWWPLHNSMKSLHHCRHSQY